MPDPEHDRGTALAWAIIRHLAAHPDAADSLVGIRQWWVGGRFSDMSDADVRSTLERLMQAGHLDRVRLADGTEIYSRRRDADASDV